MSGARVVARRCPDCGAAAGGRAGLEWFVCPACPLAFDPFHAPARRLPTSIPEGTDHGALLLPLYRFQIAPVGGQQRRIAWVCGCRILHLQIHGDPGARLTDAGWDPPLRRAPLRSRLARGPGAALRILRRRMALAPSSVLPVASVDLVGVPLVQEGDLVREPVSGAVMPVAVLLPAPRSS